MNYIPRLLAPKIQEVQKYYPVTVVTGPRQSGKTSLCRNLFPDYKYLNLEDLTTRAIAEADPTRFIDSAGDRLVIDEVQNVPQLLSIIQVRVDEDRSRRYILTGSSNFSLLHTVSQSLAGRSALFTLLPFSFPEMPESILAADTDRLMFMGQYPGVVADGIPSDIFYRNYYNTYVERDVRDLLRVSNLANFDKFVRLLAARAGSEFNASAIAREVGVSSVTVSGWLSLLRTAYIVYAVQPYHANISKRLTKMPKIYFYDTGLLCYLLGIESPEQIENHVMRGALFENLAMGELMKKRLNMGLDPTLSFYREHAGKEVDAIISSGGLHLYEIKSGRTFKKEFMANMEYLAGLLKEVTDNTVIYDGASMPPSLLNIRNI